ncbi:hypothetical protein BH09MYX1_BH09MYX1_67920 [soil metagenome]
MNADARDVGQSLDDEARMTRLRFAFAIAFAFTMLVHVAGAVRNGDDGSSPMRHAVFAALNGAFALLFALGIRWLAFPLTALALQQGYSHGTDLVNAARRGELDGASAIVLVFLPLALVYAWRAWLRKVARDDRPDDHTIGGRPAD